MTPSTTRTTETTPGARSQGMRDRIIDAAIGPLRERGLKRLGQSQVAKAAHMPQGHRTYYFPRKHDLMLAVAAKALDYMQRTLATAAPPGSGTTSARLEATEKLAAEVCDRARTRMLLGLLVESDDNPELRALMLQSTEGTRQLVSAAMRVPPGSVDVSLALGALWGLSLQEFLREPDATPEARHKAIVAVIHRFSECYSEKKAA